MSEKLKGHLVMLVTVIIFGLNIPVTKSLMPDWVSSYGVTLLRMGFACIAFWLVSLFLPKEKVSGKDMWIMVLGGLFGMVFNQVAFIVGLDMTSSIDAGIIATVTPLLVMLLSAIFLKEPISLKKAGGVALGASGALLIILSGMHSGHSGNSSFWGNLLCFFSSLSYAIYLIFTRSIIQKYSAVTLMKWMFLYAALMSLPFGLSDVIHAKAFTAVSEFSVWWRVIYFTLFATFITYFLIPVALKRIRPTTVSMYNYVQPLVASIAAISIGQDSLTWEKPVAAVLIFVGVYFVTVSKSRADVERMEEEKKWQKDVKDDCLCDK